MSVRDDINDGKYDLEKHPDYQPGNGIAIIASRMATPRDKTVIEQNRARRRANMELQGRLDMAFKAAVLAEVGLTTHPKRELAWSIARDHSSNYADLLTSMEELAELMV